MDIPVRDFLKATFNTAIYPFGEIIIYLMLFRFLSEQKKLGSSIIWGMSLGMINIVALTLLAITVLQNLGSIYTYPVHAMITRIDIANIITRVDVLGGSAGLLLGIMKIAVLYYAATLGAASCLSLVLIPRWYYLWACCSLISASFNFQMQTVYSIIT